MNMPGMAAGVELRQIIYMAALFTASVLFLLGLRGLSHVKSARRGMIMAATGMLIAVVGTLLHNRIVTYEWIIGGLVAGTLIGIPLGLWIPMTKMPERIAFSHAFGGLAVALVGISEYFNYHQVLGRFDLGAIGFEVLLGTVTFTGSLMAFGKLQGFLSGRPQTFPGQKALNFGLLGTALILIAMLVSRSQSQAFFYSLVATGLFLGVLLVVPIGGADMPVVICLLNSYAGLAAAATGFALNNPVLIVCGALDGGSGFILAVIMSKAMNRSFGNVMFGAFGKTEASHEKAKGEGQYSNVKSCSSEEAAMLLSSSQFVIIAPGYGMAVAHAQHAVWQLTQLLEKRGATVKFAIHPVAGRMPGHMNVLLAEAQVPYEQLVEMERINPEFSQADVALVIGANDVTNPAARNEPGSPIYGMPILDVDKAKSVIVIKRSLGSGFSGIKNPLFEAPNVMMMFEDAKSGVEQITKELKELG